MRVPEWLYQSWWADRGYRLGQEAARRHPRAAVGLVGVMNIAFVGLACLQVASQWHGATSAVCFALGISFSALLLGAQRRSSVKRSPIAAALATANMYVGPVVGVSLFAALVVHRATTGAAALIAFGDGYVAALFAGLLLFLQRPSKVTP